MPASRKSRGQSHRIPSAVDILEPSLTNAQIAELLATEAESASRPILAKAFRRAARKAHQWPEEAFVILQHGRSLTELPGIGPYLEKVVRAALERPPAIPHPPDLRQNFFTWTEADAILQNSPAWAEEVKGDLQMHSVWSDGSGTIQEMADAADALGYAFIAITDHSKGLKIAGGIDEQQLEQQAIEIESVNAGLETAGRPLRVLRALELNLSPTGEGDMAADSLHRLDLVLGCFHSSLRKKDDQTERYIAGLRNPTIQILGHPRGRIYNFRLGLTADWTRVFAVAAELDKAVEIDAYPDRQDLSLDLLRLAKKAGCRISIGTDSHGPTQLRFIRFGLAAACRAGIDRNRILNFMSYDQLKNWAASVRETAQ